MARAAPARPAARRPAAPRGAPGAAGHQPHQPKGDFDVPRFFRPIAQTPPDIKQMPGGGGFNLVIAGWSPMRGHPILFCYEEHPWGTPAEVRVVEPPCVVYQPNIEGAPLSPADVADPAVIMALARRQAAQLHQRYGEKSAGGLLIEATVRRDSINICHLGDLDAAEREAAA